MESKEHPGWTWNKAIPERRDRFQSKLLTWTTGLLLGAGCLQAACTRAQATLSLEAAGLSVGFLLLVYALKAGTNGAGVCGGMVSFLIIDATTIDLHAPFHSGLAALISLFVLTFLATRFGRARKSQLGLAESRHGRRASQVVANVGAAGLLCLPFLAIGHGRPEGHRALTGLLVLAVLAEATADTVASEIGQAAGGRPIQLFNMTRVEPGQDGAISLAGTLAGMLGAALVAAVGSWAMALAPKDGLLAWSAGVAGLFFDSVLGATIERRGWLGNDLVNFSSTLFSALCASFVIKLR